MHLHLLIPGLLWPDEQLRDALTDLKLDALSQILGRGRASWQAPAGRETWLARQFGFDAQHTPYAALRLLGEAGGESPGAHHWMCVDPVHLRFSQHGLLLGDARTLELTLDEAQHLVAELNRQFADLGQFIACAADRWLLRLHQPTQVICQPPSHALGRRVDLFLPAGDDGRLWIRHFNEVQVVLYNHPVNGARESVGRSTVNSAWFWGAGSLADHERASAAYTEVSADDALAQGFARHAGIPAHALPAGFEQLRISDAAKPALVVLDQLASAAHYGDLYTWRDGLQLLENHWLAPSLAALKSGRIDSLRLTGLGDLATLDIQIKRTDLWKFWLRRQSLADLPVPDLTVAP